MDKLTEIVGKLEHIAELFSLIMTAMIEWFPIDNFVSYNLQKNIWNNYV